MNQVAVPRKVKDCGDIEKAIAIIGKYSDVRPSETVWSEKRLLNSAEIGWQNLNGLTTTAKNCRNTF